MLNLGQNNRRKPLPTKPASLKDPREHMRLLMQYQGIFPNNIKEFAEKVIPLQKKRKNFAR